MVKDSKLREPETEDEARQYVREFGMVLGDLEPAYTVQLTERQVLFLKDAAKFTTEERWGSGHTLYFEGAFLTEFALHVLLRERFRKHRWVGLYFGDAKLAPRDFSIWRNGRAYTVGVSSRRHVDLVLYLENPIQFYPQRRLRKPQQISSYTISSSVISNEDGTSTIAFWGAMTKRQLIKQLTELELKIAHPSYGDRVDIPLRQFSPQLLKALIEGIDEAD